ncbi:MAG TPA: LPP20 family lipoprotein [Gammaproteobacteria bacterium]|nr:LPP20 family lipoprotein [Gammaproteobacteria bacterium]
MTKLLLATLPLLLVACSHAPRPDLKPAWISGADLQYPASRFLTGQGEADSQAVARDRARADLAKNFSVNIREKSSDVASYAQKGDEPAANAAKISRAITTQTDQLLRGVRIADIWQDPATQQWFALAVLPRQRTAASLRERIAKFDAATRAWLLQARSAQDPIAKIAAADRAVAAQMQRAALQSELRVVDATGRGVAAPWNLGELQADQTALLARVVMTAAARGKDADKVQALLAGALAEAGFSVKSGAPYTMTAALDYNILPPRNGWYWITGTLSVSLDGANAAHGMKRWPLKVSATDPALARQRLMGQVAEDLHDGIREAVLNFAETKAVD